MASKRTSRSSRRSRRSSRPATGSRIERRRIRLTGKEIDRSDQGYTIVVRPQARGYLVAAVKIEGQSGLLLDHPSEPPGRRRSRTFTRYVETQSQIPAAARDIARWLDKMGYPGDMGGAARLRRQHAV